MAEQETSSDFQDHMATYKGFLRAVKWSVGLIAIVMVFLYFVAVY